MEASYCSADRQSSPAYKGVNFRTDNGLFFAANHLVIDIWTVRRLDQLGRTKRALLDAVEAAGGTLLHIHLHKFGSGGGISGVATLVEGHVSVHTWPERNYAALDIFMGGDASSRIAFAELCRAFKPVRLAIAESKRGIDC